MRTLIFMTALVICSLTISKAGDDHVVIGEKFKIKSEVLNEDRQFLVYLPQSYKLGEAKYPVMYLLDGKIHFLHTSGIVDYLSARALMPEIIIVAIVNVDRGRDFSPTHIQKIASSGGAEKFSEFLSKELKPYIQKNYRTNGYDILTGHSLGGLYATYVLLNNPYLFDSYIAISPYMMYDEAVILKDAESKLESNYKNKKSFFMTVGNEPEYFETLAKFESVIKSKSPDNLDLTYIKMEDEDHNTIPHLSIYEGLENIFSGWRLPKEVYKEGLDAIDNHYKKLSLKFGYDIPVPEEILNQLGYVYIGQEDYKKAIIVFEANVKRYSQSANVYDSLGEALEKDGQFVKAEKNYRKAVELAEKQKHPYLDVYKKNLGRAEMKITHK